MITEEKAEASVTYLRDSSRAAAQARAERAYVEAYRKTIKAQIMQEHGLAPLGAQEREAYADPRYLEHLKAIKDAVEKDEYHRFMREAASAAFEAWRTQSSNERAARV